MDFKDSDRIDKAGEDRILIRGLVIPSEWDESGKVAAVAIASFTEEKYLLAENAAASDLLNFIEHEVAVIGSLRRDGNRLYLTISDFFSFGSKSDEPVNE